MRVEEFELPWPPSVNHYWKPNVRRGKFNGFRVCKDGMDFRHTVQMKFRFRGRGEPDFEPFKGRVGIRIRCHNATRHRYDLDNICKATLDALTHAGVWIDDSVVDRLEVVRGELRPERFISVCITEIG